MSSHAKQVRFTQQNIGDGRLFTYLWQDAEQTQQSLQFQLSHTQLNKMPNTGAAYRPQLAQRAIRAGLMKHAQKIDPRQAKVNISQQGAQISIQVSSTKPGEAQKITDELAAQRDILKTKYLKDNFYMPHQNQYGQKAIKHDHARYANLSMQGASNIADAIKASLDNPKDFRAFVNYALSWIQAIPYDTLEDRISSNGSGFASPRQLIIANKGDCDSKSTLMASILKAYAPTIKVRMIFLPNHALLAVRMNPNKMDESLKIEQQNYVLLEPTGPAFYTLGEIAPSSKNSLRNRQYTTEIM